MNLTRRKFLGLLGGAAAAASIPKAAVDVLAGPSPVVVTDYTIGQYADYLSISDLSFETVIDPVVANVAKEIAYRMALTLDNLEKISLDSVSST